MHKGVIILTKASNREEAIDNVTSFLEPYGDGDVWDWYSIGNRWNNCLAPKDKMEEFNKWIKETYKDVFKDGFSYSIKDIENDNDRPIIQNKWKEIGLKGYNPYYSGYGFDIPEDDKDNYNVIPLKDCIDIIKEHWLQDIDKEKEKAWKELLEAKEKIQDGKYDMTGYLAGKYKDLQYENFCFDTNVYNATTDEAEKIPDNIEEYWAVVVDMHN